MSLTSSCKGQFNGKVIFRFSHGFDHGGGLEQYLDDVNTVLSSQHRLQIVQLRLTTGDSRRETLSLNGSTVTNYFVPAAIYKASKRVHLFIDLLPKLNRFFRDEVLYRPFLHRAFFQRILESRRAPKGICDPLAVLERVRHILGAYRFDGAIMHSFGTQDAKLTIKELKLKGIRLGMINHFSNDRFLNTSVREQVRQSDIIGSVGRSGMPAYLADRYEYVGDGIDTEFYRPSHIPEVDNSLHQNRVLLPARLVVSKGHLDLVAAAKIAKESGVLVDLYFAGRPDSEEYKLKVEETAKKAGLYNQVHFLGAQSKIQMRDWYAGSIFTVLPTHHHEGLGRVSLEAQAMGKPIIAYDIGGVKEGFIDQKTGILIPLGDIRALANALVRLVKNPKQRFEMGKAGRQFVENNFSYQSLLDRHERFLCKLLSQVPADAPKQ